MQDFNKLTKQFLLGEAYEKPNLSSYIQMLQEIITNLRPATARDIRRIQIAKEHLREIRRHAKTLEERVGFLEEQIRIFENNGE
jgi:flagellar biosynthesis chaperone FliJ